MPRLLHVLLATLALLLAGAAQAQAGRPTVHLAGDAIVFDAYIDARSVARFLELLREPRVTRLVITSPGGHVGPALEMAAAVHARQLDVEVAGACFSSCANYIFPAGREKHVARAGILGWHGNMAHLLYLQQAGHGQWSPRETEEAYRLAQREAEFFRRIGVDGFVCWFAKIAPYHEAQSYDLSVEDMERFGIRDVSVGPGAALNGHDVRRVRVEWAALEAARPVVQLTP